MLNTNYSALFGPKAVIGMIHLTGDDPVHRALDELEIFYEEGVDGAIIENYYGTTLDVMNTLDALQDEDIGVRIGVNILPNNFCDAFTLSKKYGAQFIQLDHVAGRYKGGTLDSPTYTAMKRANPEVVVLGGVWPKYYSPARGSDLETDILQGKQRAEAIVVTGAGTGEETPLSKIQQFRDVLGDHPLIVGAGVTLENAYSQLSIADGCIVGTSIKKNGQTQEKVDRTRVRDLMEIVRELR